MSDHFAKAFKLNLPRGRQGNAWERRRSAGDAQTASANERKISTRLLRGRSEVAVARRTQYQERTREL
eukprot:5881744-Pyramimonas_sp.AAC.1